MKIKAYILSAILSCSVFSCTNLDISPMNVVQDKDLFTSQGGITIYMSRMYSELPIEDFRYSASRLFNNFWIINPFSCISGEGLSRDQTSASSEMVGYWTDAYKLIREVNYFIETLPKNSASFTTAQINSLMGEAYFIRGVTYFALAKRYGGIPVIDKVLQYPDQNIEELKIPRSSEEETYNFIAADLDLAIQKMDETSQSGRANKYVAAAFKSRAMLFAGSIAKYNQAVLFDGNQKRLCGIPSDKANAYFKLSYDAAKMLENKYSLFMKDWKDNDREAQYKNYVNLFFDKTSSENIFIKGYKYPETVHGFDAYNVPRQSMGANGYSAEINPTLNYVELFDGIPKDANGKLKNRDDNGKYLLYNNTMDIFATAEPRLRATVILPGDIFKGESIEIRRGIYTGSVTTGIDPLLPEGSTSNYPATNIVSSANASQTLYTLPDGTKMNPAGKSGTFTQDGTCSVSGFSIRKYLNPDMPQSLVLENRSDQTWIEMRYAEVLLNRAEAAYELFLGGQTDIDYQQDAFTGINLIRKRAGATLLGSKSDLNSIDIVRNERRKELAFENKTWWDLKRWRIADKEQNSTIYRVLMPFYASNAGKYFFDARLDERNARYTFDTRWYYQQIPSGEIVKSPNIKQNPGF